MALPAEKHSPPPTGRHTVADLLAQSGDRRLELIDGAMVEKAAPSGEHSYAQGFALATLIPPFVRRGGGSGRPGGWWISGEIDIELDGDVFRPDLAGWRRDRVPERPTGRPIAIRPDWICEVLSPSNAVQDTVVKLRRYHQAAIPHYWIIDPGSQNVVVYRHADAGYAVVKIVRSGEVARLEPFDAIELRVGLLFGEDPDDAPPAPAAP